MTGKHIAGGDDFAFVGATTMPTKSTRQPPLAPQHSELADPLGQQTNSVGNISHSSFVGTSAPRSPAGAFDTTGFQQHHAGSTTSLGGRVFDPQETGPYFSIERERMLQAYPLQQSPTPSRRDAWMFRSQGQHSFASRDLYVATEEDSDADARLTGPGPSTQNHDRCCVAPDPITHYPSHDIVCYNCGKKLIGSDISAPSLQSRATALHNVDHGNIQDPYRGSRLLTSRHTASSRYVSRSLYRPSRLADDPNRIRMVEYAEPDSSESDDEVMVDSPPIREVLFSQCYDTEKSFCPTPSFPKFMELPRELRERVYSHALQSDRSIAPHLCNEGRPAPEGKAEDGKAIRFHDENQTAHNATCKLLTLTRVSRLVREESLPIFYGVNTFDTTGDTPTYFLRLQQLGRFHLIRHVDFWLRLWTKNLYSQQHLRMLLHNIEEQKVFEMDHQKAKQVEHIMKAAAAIKSAPNGVLSKVPNVPDDTKFPANDLEVLKNHPLHLMGGLEAHLSCSFLVLRMLSAQFHDSEYNRQLIVHVPSSAMFDSCTGFQYFPPMCEGLGIQLKFVSGRDVETNRSGTSFRLSWEQKYQKKDFTASTTAKDCNEVEALTERVLALYPNIEELPRPVKWTYMRRLCKQGEIEWFSVKTAGGGIR